MTDRCSEERCCEVCGVPWQPAPELVAGGESVVFSLGGLEIALDLIREERAAQDRKWGPNRRLPAWLWMPILVEEVGEVAKALLEEESDERVIHELSQVAAVAVAWIEAIRAGRVVR